MDSITLIQFVVPFVMALIFTMLSLAHLKKPDWLTVISCILASIGWLIFSLTWPAVSTTEMFQGVAYLFGAFFLIFAVLS